MKYALKLEYVVNFDVILEGEFIEGNTVTVEIIKNHRVVKTLKRIVKFSSYHGDLYITINNYDYLYNMFEILEFSNFLLEDETLNEMATSYTDGNSSIRVHPVDSGNYVYFKYCNSSGYNKDTAVARISLLEPEYIFNHKDNHPVLLLTTKGKKNLNKKLDLPSGNYLGYTVFQAILIDFNREKYGVDLLTSKKVKTYSHGNPLPLNLPKPDYTLLPSIDDAEKQINGFRIVKM